MAALERITSAKNPAVRTMRELKDRRAREASGHFLVEGEKMILEARGCGLRLHRLFLEEGLPLPSWAASLPAYAVPRGILEVVCDTRTPQGMCAEFDMPSFVPLTSAPARIVALDGVQDPGNVGTIWRTADAAGFQGLLLGAGSADPFSPKVQRAAMGSGFRVPCMRAENLSDALRSLSAQGWRVIASSLRGEDFYSRPDAGEKFVLVIGNEARGISEAVQAAADMLVKLPMRGGAESLNAAVAAGIMMYELMRGQ